MRAATLLSEVYNVHMCNCNACPHRCAVICERPLVSWTAAHLCEFHTAAHFLASAVGIAAGVGFEESQLSVAPRAERNVLHARHVRKGAQAGVRVAAAEQLPTIATLQVMCSLQASRDCVCRQSLQRPAKFSTAGASSACALACNSSRSMPLMRAQLRGVPSRGHLCTCAHVQQRRPVHT